MNWATSVIYAIVKRSSKKFLKNHFLRTVLLKKYYTNKNYISLNMVSTKIVNYEFTRISTSLSHTLTLTSILALNQKLKADLTTKINFSQKHFTMSLLKIFEKKFSENKNQFIEKSLAVILVVSPEKFIEWNIIILREKPKRSHVDAPEQWGFFPAPLGLEDRTYKYRNLIYFEKSLTSFRYDRMGLYFLYVFITTRWEPWNHWSFLHSVKWSENYVILIVKDVGWDFVLAWGSGLRGGGAWAEARWRRRRRIESVKLRTHVTRIVPTRNYTLPKTHPAHFHTTLHV